MVAMSINNSRKCFLEAIFVATKERHHLIELQDYSKSFKLIYKMFPQWVQWIYQCVPEKRRRASCHYPLGEVVLLGLCMFLFRYRSLRSFVREFRDNSVAISNLNEFFTIKAVPSEDELRYALSKIPSSAFNKILQKIHQRLERKKQVQSFRLTYSLQPLSPNSSKKMAGHLSSRLNQNEIRSYFLGMIICMSRKKNGSLKMQWVYNTITSGRINCPSSKIKKPMILLLSIYSSTLSQTPTAMFCITTLG